MQSKSISLNKQCKQDKFMDASPEAICTKAGSSQTSGSFLDEGLRAGPIRKCSVLVRPRVPEGHVWEEKPTVPDTAHLRNPGLHRPHGRPRPAFLRIFLALPDTRSKWASFHSLPTSISSCKRKEQNRKCLRQNAPWVDERKQRVHLHPSTRPAVSGQGPGPRPCCC